jgi:hypothetical protein
MTTADVKPPVEPGQGRIVQADEEEVSAGLLQVRHHVIASCV